MSDNSLGDYGASTVAQALTHQTTITMLDLACKAVRVAPVIYEGANKREQLRPVSPSLRIRGTVNNIEDAGAMLLAGALRSNTTLTALRHDSEYGAGPAHAAVTFASRMRERVCSQHTVYFHCR